MLHKVIKPSGILKRFIKSFHIMESNDQLDFLPTQRIYTYGSIVLVFHYGKPSLFQKRDENPYIEPRTVICGQQSSFYDLALAGKTGMIFIIFKPFGAGVFFNLPMNEIENHNLAFEQIIGPEAWIIEHKIQEASSDTHRLQIIEEYLFKKLIKESKDHERISSSFQVISLSRGKTSIKTLSDHACLSIRQFERRFSELVGTTPKQYLRIVRFQEVLKQKRVSFQGDYTTLALDCGYYDQSHFIHDFKKITNVSPKKFFDKNHLT